MTDQADRPAGGKSTGPDMRFRLALHMLSPMERDVFLLSARDGLDYAGISARLGLAIGDVEHHLARALVALADALDDPPS